MSIFSQPVLSRPLTKEVPVDRVVAALPPLPKLKKEEVVDVIKRSIGVCNHRFVLQFVQDQHICVGVFVFVRTLYNLVCLSVCLSVCIIT